MKFCENKPTKYPEANWISDSKISLRIFIMWQESLRTMSTRALKGREGKLKKNLLKVVLRKCPVRYQVQATIPTREGIPVLFTTEWNYLRIWQNIGTTVVEPKIFLSAPAPRSRKSELRLQLRPRLQLILQHSLKINFFDFSIRTKILTIYKNFLSNHDFFFLSNFFKSVVNRKEPGPQFAISAPAPGSWSFYQQAVRKTLVSKTLMSTKQCFGSGGRHDPFPMFLGLPDPHPDLLVTSTNPDPAPDPSLFS